MSRRDKLRAIGEDASGAKSAPGETLQGASRGEINEPVDESAWLETDDASDDASGPAFDDAGYAAPPRFGWVIPALCLLALAGWSAFFVWAMRAELLQASSLAPNQWLAWIVNWSIPCLLIGMVWLLALRNSTIEARRFASAADLLRRESAALEKRVSTINGELSLAREFLGSQARDLDAMGRMATERLSAHSEELKQLIADNHAQVSAIGSVSETALANMKSLREDLPVIANASRDVTSQIGNAGRTAHDHLAKLGEGFDRVGRSGETTEASIKSLLAKIDTTLSEFDERVSGIETAMSARFEALRERTSGFASDVDAAESEALSALQGRVALLESETEAVHQRLRETGGEAVDQINASKERWHEEIIALRTSLGELDEASGKAAAARIAQLDSEVSALAERLQERDAKFAEAIARRQDEFDTREAQASELLSQRLIELDDMLMQRREAQSAETGKLGEEVAQLESQVSRLGELIASVSRETQESRALIADGVSQVAAQFGEDKQGIAQVKKDLTELTEASIRLMEIIQSSAQQSGQQLPEAIEAALTKLTSFEAQAEQASALIMSTRDEGAALHGQLEQTNAKIAEAKAAIEAISAKLGDHSEEAMAKLGGLRGGLAKLDEESKAYADSTLASLREAISDLGSATKDALSNFEAVSSEKVQALSGQISEDAVAALERALRNDTAEMIGKFEQSAAHASGKGREVTVQLRDQLVKVNELTKNLEQRIARAKEQAEEQVDNDFARRMALITDSLNSASIDISGALANEVSDTEWDAYLKGDRGIFTRRAVRLAGSSEARDIAELYQSDESFKAVVNRYIHDFEAMLRSMLSTRDGNALSVTILGSDMGKLYVTLAQAIERFRK